MRALHVAHSVYPLSQAGTEIYAAQLMEALGRQGVDVLLAVPDTATRGAADEVRKRVGDQVRSIPLAPGGRWGNKLRRATFRGAVWASELRRLVRSFQPDVIHVQHPMGFGLSSLRVLAREGVPTVVTLPDYWLLCEGILRECRGDAWACARCCAKSSFWARLGTLPAYLSVLARRRRVLNYVRRYRPTLAAISDSTRRAFEEAGFPRELLTTRPWGLDDSAIRARCVGRKRRTPTRIGYLGTLRPHKGCHVLLEAFKRINGRAELHYYGSGDEAYGRQLREAAAGVGVTFHGRFDHARVPEILDELDVVVIPSIWEETYCLVFQEAAAARKPVVASRVGGLADRIVDGVNGFLVPAADPTALAKRLDWLLDHYTEVQGRLDYERCRITMEEDSRGWVEIYEATIRRIRGWTVTPTLTRRSSFVQRPRESGGVSLVRNPIRPGC